MTREQIIYEIKEILLLDEDFDINKTIIEFDSLSSLLLAEFLDNTFKISITKDQIKKFDTVKNILDFIDKK